MKTFAVIDIGSNSVRLMFVADGKVLYKDLETTRLGEGLANRPYLKAEAIERTAQAVSRFYARASAEGAERICVFATAAVRSSENGNAFCERVARLCGASVHVVSGDEEAELGILGALKNNDGAIIDIGGASTEIIARKGGEIIYQRSINVGVVRLFDLCGRDLTALQAFCVAAVKEFGQVPFGADVYAIGGTATSVAAFVLGQKQYDGKQVTGFRIGENQLAETVQALAQISVEELVQNSCVPFKRAEVLLGGAVWLQTIVKELGINELIASDADNLEGYAIKYRLL